MIWHVGVGEKSEPFFLGIYVYVDDYVCVFCALSDIFRDVHDSL